MNVIVKFSALMLKNYWILSLSNIYFVSGDKPHCEGEPLDANKFSNPEDVGFVRDICVEIIAKNLISKLNYPVPNQCEELANIRTSTCYPKCVKWKRSNFLNKWVTIRVMKKAEILMEYFNNVVSKEVSLNNNVDERFIFERINEGKRRMIESGAADEYSHIIGELEALKKNFCTRDHLEEFQIAYQKIIRVDDEETIRQLRTFFDNEDFMTAIKKFIRNFEAKYGLILRYHIENDVAKAGDQMTNGITRLKFVYRQNNLPKGNAVILKVPSLASSSYAELKETNIFDREAYFYETLLPKLYELGKCKPFAPKLYAVTSAKALVLQDLTVKGYKAGSQIGWLDLDHSLVSLDLLANYHALGYIYLQNPSQYNPNMLLLGSYQPTLFASLRKDSFNKFCRMLESHVSAPFYQYILKMKNEIIAHPMSNQYPRENSFMVIVHGDFRPYNILFKYNNRDLVCKAKIIDWQISRQASPVLDLIHFFVTSLPINFFLNHYETLLKFYLEKLNNQLTSLKSVRLYNRQDLNEDMAHYKYYYLRLLCFIWQETVLAGRPSQEIDQFWSSAIKWLHYLESK